MSVHASLIWTKTLARALCSRFEGLRADTVRIVFVNYPVLV